MSEKKEKFLTTENVVLGGVMLGGWVLSSPLMILGGVGYIGYKNKDKIKSLFD